MVLYGINLVLLSEELMDADPTLLSPFYANDAEFDGSERWIAVECGGVCLLMDQGPDRGYFPKPAKSILITYNLEEKDEANS